MVLLITEQGIVFAQQWLGRAARFLRTLISSLELADEDLNRFFNNHPAFTDVLGSACLRLNIKTKHDKRSLVLHLVDAIGLLLEEVDIATSLLESCAHPFVKRFLHRGLFGLNPIKKLVSFVGRSLDLTLQHLLLLLVVQSLVDFNLVLQISYGVLDLLEAPLRGGHVLLKLSLERCLLCGLLCDVSEPVLGGQQGPFHLNDVSSSILTVSGQLFQGILNVAHNGALADSLTKHLVSLIFTILQSSHELSLLVA